MRGINGITIAKEIKNKNSQANIIFCTGYEEYSLTAWELNSSGYLLKPITEEKLRNTVNNLRYQIQYENRVILKSF